MTARATAFSSHDVRRFLSLLHGPDSVFEIRVPKYGKYKLTASGYFDNIDAAVAAVEQWDGKANVYTTLNLVEPVLLARAVNRIVERADATTADVDVFRRHWLFVDVDPVRPTGISSTSDELEAAESLAQSIEDFLTAEGWPQPLAAMSGNGANRLYPIDLPNDDAARDLVAGVLKTLDERFSNERATIDTSVSNASRIVGVVGTAKVKGDSTIDRPHRRSRLLAVPDQMNVVRRDQLEALLNEQESGTRPAGSFRRTSNSGSLAAALDAAGIEYRMQPPDANGVTWYHLHRCPFHEDGRDFECGAGQKLPDGPYAGHCFHPEGADRGWRDFKSALGLFFTESAQAVHRAGRSTIVVTNRHRREIAEDAWAAMLAANHPVKFFRHGNAIAEIRKHEDFDYPLIRHLATAALAGRLDRMADFVRLSDGHERPARPPRDVVEDMQALEIPLPGLSGIVGTPVFTRDGRLATNPGYQSETRLYYAPVGECVPPVASAPDETDLRVAKTLLRIDLLGDFPWADDASVANFISVLVTLMARDLIDGPTPLFALGAPKAGTGKGLLANCVGVIATGDVLPVMSDTKNEEEFRKRVTAKLLEGVAAVLFDNIKRRLDSGTLAALLTCTKWSDRILGRSEAVDLPVRTVWLITGNNLQFSDEIVRRVVSVWIDSKTEHPWDRDSFRHPDLLEWLRRHRHEVVWACLVLIQNWIARGRPAWTGRPMGSYESWCRVAGGVLEAAGIDGFLSNRPALYHRGDSMTQEWRAFTEAWWARYGDAPVTVATLVPIAQEAAPSVFEGLKDDASSRSLGTRLGKALAERQDNRFGSVFIKRAGEDAHAKTARWRLEAAGDDGDAGPTPAPHPQENEPITDSFAGVADNAGDDSERSAHEVCPTGESELCGEVRNSHPQYPQHPQADSDRAENCAGDERVMKARRAQHPQCKTCGAMVDLPGANLCGDCRRAALDRVMKGQT